MGYPTTKVEVQFEDVDALDNGIILNDPVDSILPTTLGNLAPDWVDISIDCRSVSTSKGRQDLQQAFAPGTCTIELDNANRAYDPSYSLSPHHGKLLPMRQVRVSVVTHPEEGSSTTYRIFEGYIDAWTVDYGGILQTATIEATDGLKLFSLANIDEISPATGKGLSTAERVIRILDDNAVLWDPDKREINISDIQGAMDGTTFGSDAMSALQECVNAEYSDLYINNLGNVVFRSRFDPILQARSVISQCTLGDGVPPTDELPFVGTTWENNDNRLVNHWRVKASGTPDAWQEASDEASIARYKHHHKDLDTKLNNDLQALDLATWLLQLYKDPEVQCTEITLRGLKDNDMLWNHMFGREFWDRVTVQRRPLCTTNFEELITRECFIIGINHTIVAPGSSFETVWQLLSASKYDVLSDEWVEGITLDDPVDSILPAALGTPPPWAVSAP